jgi:hypothetical protein
VSGNGGTYGLVFSCVVPVIAIRPEASTSRSNTNSWLAAVSLQRACQTIVPSGSYATVSASLSGNCSPPGWVTPETTTLPSGSSAMSAARSSERPGGSSLRSQRSVPSAANLSVAQS